MLRKNIPNLFTALNLVCGCLAAYLAFENLFQAAFFAVLLGTFFDLFDGFFARLLKVESTFGVEFDSMADLISSGFVPGIVMHQLLLKSNVQEMNIGFSLWNIHCDFVLAPIALLGFLITLAAAVRLAKFNTDDSQQQEFLGLPTPASALFLVSLPLLLDDDRFDFLQPPIFSVWGLLGISILFSILMNLPLRLFSFKVSLSDSFKKKRYQILLIVGGIVLLFLFQWAAVPMIIILYLLLSVVRNVLNGETVLSRNPLNLKRES